MNYDHGCWAGLVIFPYRFSGRCAHVFLLDVFGKRPNHCSKPETIGLCGSEGIATASVLPTLLGGGGAGSGASHLSPEVGLRQSPYRDLMAAFSRSHRHCDSQTVPPRITKDQ